MLEGLFIVAAALACGYPLTTLFVWALLVFGLRGSQNVLAVLLRTAALIATLPIFWILGCTLWVWWNQKPT